MVQYKRIGEMLLETGRIDAAQLEQALKTKLESNLRFGEVLTALGFVSEEEVTQCLADQYGYQVADLYFIEPEPEALAIVPSVTALSGLVLPVKLTPERFYCIIADPLDIHTTDSIHRLAGRPVDICLATPTELFDRITKAYGIGPKVRPVPVHAPRSKPATTTTRTKRKIKIDPQNDKFALLAAVGSINGN